MRDYNHNRLTEDEINYDDLMEKKQSVDSLSDEDIYSIISTPQHGNFEFSQSDVTRLQERINDDILRERRNRIVKRFSIACAAVIIPLLIAGTFLFYQSTGKDLNDNPFYAGEMSITTGNGEHSVTRLPDGSEVKLGPGSSLTYAMSSFNDKIRHISYTGDGYFDIARRDNVPFTINVNRFEIKVLGTSFSVRSRNYKEFSEIYLNDGSIQLTSYLTQHQYEMKPGELALINNTTGAIDIQPAADSNALSAQPVLIFRSTELKDLVIDLKTYYNIDIQITDIETGSRKFTGSVPTDDIEQALYILETAMQVNLKKTASGHYTLNSTFAS